MIRYRTVFTTERGHRHQRAALAVAPQELEITMLRQPNRDELIAALADAEYLISERVGVVDAAVFDAAPHLKLVLRLGSLTFDIDGAAAQSAGVIVCRWPVGSVIRVAEHMVMQMLALSKKLLETERIARTAGDDWGFSRRTDEDIFAYNWSQRRDVEGLWQRTVGILGFGEIGAELARRLQGWDMTVLYHKRRRLPLEVETELGITWVHEEKLLHESDFLAVLLPYFAETDLYLNATKFSRMKDGAYLVGCGSGSVIHEADLAHAIEEGKLAGAALDTFEWEPIRRDNPLIPLVESGHNVLLTPHVAAGGSAAASQERKADYTNILLHIAGKPLRYRVV